MSNISFNGGTQYQKDLITKGHDLAISLAKKAEAAVPSQGDQLRIWFGDKRLAEDVKATLKNIQNVLNSYAITYDIENSADWMVEDDLGVQVSEDGANAARLVPWRAMFIQPEELQDRMLVLAAASILFCAANLTGMGGHARVQDFVAAKAFALSDPAGSVLSPRNYLGFATAVASLTPAPTFR